VIRSLLSNESDLAVFPCATHQYEYLFGKRMNHSPLPVELTQKFRGSRHPFRDPHFVQIEWYAATQHESVHCPSRLRYQISMQTNATATKGCHCNPIAFRRDGSVTPKIGIQHMHSSHLQQSVGAAFQIRLRSGLNRTAFLQKDSLEKNGRISKKASGISQPRARSLQCPG